MQIFVRLSLLLNENYLFYCYQDMSWTDSGYDAANPEGTGCTGNPRYGLTVVIEHIDGMKTVYDTADSEVITYNINRK